MKKIFFFIIFAVMSVLCMAQVNQLVWANGRLLYASPMTNVDSLTYEETAGMDTLLLPRVLIKEVRDTMYVYDTVYVNIPCPEEKPEDNPQNPNCNQAVIVKGDVKEYFERKEWIDSNNQSLGYYAIKDTRAAMSLKLEVTFTNTEYTDDKITYNITTDSLGKFKLNAKLYDVWDVTKTEATIVVQSYLSSVTHYYEQWFEDDSEWKQNSQEVTGYYKGDTWYLVLSEDALLIGKAISFILEFVPDRYDNAIRGIEYYNSTNYMYYDDRVHGVETYRSWNPLEW